MCTVYFFWHVLLFFFFSHLVDTLYILIKGNYFTWMWFEWTHRVWDMGNLPYCQDLKFSNKLEYGVGRYWEISYGIFIKMVLDKKKTKTRRWYWKVYFNNTELNETIFPTHVTFYRLFGYICSMRIVTFGGIGSYITLKWNL